MSNPAQINIYQDAREDGNAAYSWSVKGFGAYADESPGCPAGNGLRTIAASLLQAFSVAIGEGFDGARITYHPASGATRSMDAQFAVGSPVTIERARAAADRLMGQA